MAKIYHGCFSICSCNCNTIIFVKRIKNKYPKITFILNGGIDDLNKAEILLKEFDGVMVGRLIKNKQIIRIKKNDNPWVSRGGLKLAKAIENFKINIADKVCADLGCSTGGFSDVLLKKGAKKIFATLPLCKVLLQIEDIAVIYRRVCYNIRVGESLRTLKT